MNEMFEIKTTSKSKNFFFYKYKKKHNVCPTIELATYHQLGSF